MGNRTQISSQVQMPAPTQWDKQVPVPRMPILEMPTTVAIDPVMLVNEIFDCYKNITVAKEQQHTLRMQIRERSRVMVAAIEADTKKFEMALEKSSEERMKFISTVCEAMRQDRIDEYSLRICEKILDYLTGTSPMDSIGRTMDKAMESVKWI